MATRPAGPSSGRTYPATYPPRPLLRLLVALAMNLALLVAVTVLASRHKGLPELTAETLMVGLLPVSAAMGLVLVCRRLDLSLPALFVLAAMLRANRFAFEEGAPAARLAAIGGICAGACLVAAAVTWYGRIASGLWTGLVALGATAMAAKAEPLPVPLGAVEGWPWPVAVGVSMGFLVLGAAVLGGGRLVVPPSRPPLIGGDARGFAGLASAWVIAGLAVALAASSDKAVAASDDPLLVYFAPLAAAALSGALVLRGRWGAVAAVGLASVGHLVWALAWSADLGGREVDLVLPAAAPLAAVPLYLLIDAAIRRWTRESAPTGLLA
jgi:hypothetical protein